MRNLLMLVAIGVGFGAGAVMARLLGDGGGFGPPARAGLATVMLAQFERLALPAGYWQQRVRDRVRLEVETSRR